MSWINDKSHPIWGLMNTVIRMGFVLLLVGGRDMLMASNYDADEYQRLLLLLLGGATGELATRRNL